MAKIESARQAIDAQQETQTTEIKKPAPTLIDSSSEQSSAPVTPQQLKPEIISPDTHPDKYRRPEDKDLIRHSDGPPPQ